MAGMRRTGCERRKGGKCPAPALWVPRHTPSAYCVPRLCRASLPRRGLEVSPDPDPTQPSTNNGCRRQNKYFLVLASQAEGRILLSPRAPWQVVTAGTVLHDTLSLNSFPSLSFPASPPVFSGILLNKPFEPECSICSLHQGEPKVRHTSFG